VIALSALKLLLNNKFRVAQNKKHKRQLEEAQPSLVAMTLPAIAVRLVI